MILLKQHDPRPWPLEAGGLQCRITASGGTGGSQGDTGDGPLLGLCHQWVLAVTQGTIRCPKQRAP